MSAAGAEFKKTTVVNTLHRCQLFTGLTVAKRVLAAELGTVGETFLHMLAKLSALLRRNLGE